MTALREAQQRRRDAQSVADFDNLRVAELTKKLRAASERAARSELELEEARAAENEAMRGEVAS